VLSAMVWSEAEAAERVMVQEVEALGEMQNIWRRGYKDASWERAQVGHGGTVAAAGRCCSGAVPWHSRVVRTGERG
jgi:hypothetical protein